MDEKKELLSKVDTILWEDWDPIGINDCAPKDEYENYVFPIFSMLIQGKTNNEIAMRLTRFEKVEMGLEVSEQSNERNYMIAKKILALI